MLFPVGPKREAAVGAACSQKSCLPCPLRCAAPRLPLLFRAVRANTCSRYLYRLLFHLQLGAMDEDLQLPSELLDDGFFHGFFVEREEKRVEESRVRVATGDRYFLDDDGDKVLDLRNEATEIKGAAEAELWRLSQYQPRLPNQARNTSHLLVHRQLQAARILHLKQQQLLQQQLWAERQSKAKRTCHSPGVFSSGRTPFLVQHQLLPGPGMTAVFLCSSGGAKKESTGTGVFLPRTAGSNPQPQKKSACSTVFIPAKVVQALNLANHHGRGTNPARSQAHPQHSDLIKTSMSCLPQEWTY